MANSSPVQRRSAFSATAILSSPSVPRLSEYMYESRNSPELHKFKQQEAEASNQRVRDAAVKALELYELKIETLRIERERLMKEEKEKELREQQKKRAEIAAAEERRLEEDARAEKQRCEDEARLEKLRAESILKASPPPSQPAPAPAQEQPTSNGAKISPTPASANPFKSLTTSLATAGKADSTESAAPEPAKAAQAQQESSSQALAPTTQDGQGQTEATSVQPPTDRHIEIHQKLKELRKFIETQGKANRTFKAGTGDLRREIRRSVGQITVGGLRDNKAPLMKIRENLRKSLQVPSQPIDVSFFVLQPREPVDGATHNGPQLPSLFLFLLNCFSKNVIKQFVDEAGPDTTKAEGVGQVVASIFSEADFHWRGKSLIDILQAKYRVLCPVLFGFSGDDRTNSGRALNGWRKKNGKWVPDMVHYEGMAGLAAGFAAMTLRDFSKATTKQNPWPPTTYWAAMAVIVNSPTEQLSDTQCVILKAMIEHYEASFIKLYGTAAVAAMRAALVEFPAGFAKKSAYVEALIVHPKLLAQKTGLDLLAM